MFAAIFDAVYDQASAILDVVAVAAIAGSVLAYSRMKAALLASESAGNAWHEERDAEKARADRNAADVKAESEEKFKLLAEVAALKTRPDLARLEALMAESTDHMKMHEIAAGERTERLIAAIQELAA